MIVDHPELGCESTNRDAGGAAPINKGMASFVVGGIAIL
jgi:hypothetical protein